MWLGSGMKKLEERGVWVPIEIRMRDIIERTLGLINTGYRTEEPYIALPTHLAKKLGMHPKSIEENSSKLHENRLLCRSRGNHGG